GRDALPRRLADALPGHRTGGAGDGIEEHLIEAGARAINWRSQDARIVRRPLPDRTAPGLDHARGPDLSSRRARVDREDHGTIVLLVGGIAADGDQARAVVRPAEGPLPQRASRKGKSAIAGPVRRDDVDLDGDGGVR